MPVPSRAPPRMLPAWRERKDLADEERGAQERGGREVKERDWKAVTKKLDRG